MRHIYILLLIGALFCLGLFSSKANAEANVTVSLLADKGQAKISDTITYKVIASNPRDRSINARVIVNIPDHLLPLATSPEAAANPQNRTLQWDNLTLKSNSSTTLAFRAKPAADAAPGSNIRITAQIDGDGINDSGDISTIIINASEPTTETTASLPTARTGSELFWFVSATLVGLAALYYFISHNFRKNLH